MADRRVIRVLLQSAKRTDSRGSGSHWHGDEKALFPREHDPRVQIAQRLERDALPPLKFSPADFVGGVIRATSRDNRAIDVVVQARGRVPGDRGVVDRCRGDREDSAAGADAERMRGAIGPIGGGADWRRRPFPLYRPSLMPQSRRHLLCTPALCCR